MSTSDLFQCFSSDCSLDKIARILSIYKDNGYFNENWKGAYLEYLFKNNKFELLDKYVDFTDLNFFMNSNFYINTDEEMVQVIKYIISRDQYTFLKQYEQSFEFLYDQFNEQEQNYLYKFYPEEVQDAKEEIDTKRIKEIAPAFKGKLPTHVVDNILRKAGYDSLSLYESIQIIAPLLESRKKETNPR